MDGRTDHSINKIAPEDTPDDIFDEQAIAESMLSLWQIFSSLTTSSLSIAASNTQTMQYFIFGLLLVRQSDNNEMVASTGLILKTFGFIFMALAPIYGAAVTISNQRGELERTLESEPDEDHDEIYNRISAIGKSLFTITATTTPFSFAALYFSRGLLISLFRQDADIAEYAQQFTRLYATAIPGLVMRTCIGQICYGFSKNVPIMLISLGSLGISNVIGVGLSYGWFGNEAMHRTGIAIGGIIDPYLSAAALAAYIHFNKDFKKYHFLAMRNNKYIFRQIKATLKIGLPIMFTINTDIVANMAFGALIGITGGKSALVATSIIEQASPLSMIIRMSLAQTAAIEAGRLAGKKSVNTTRYARTAGLLSILISAPIPIICGAAPDVLLKISDKSFEPMPFLRELSVSLNAIQFFEAVRIILLKEMHALNDNYVPAIISMAGMSAGLISGALGSIYAFQQGENSVFVLTGSYAGGLGIAAIGMGIRWRYATKPAVIEQRQALQEALFAKPGGFTLFTCCDNNRDISARLIDISEDEKVSSASSTEYLRHSN